MYLNLNIPQARIKKEKEAIFTGKKTGASRIDSSAKMRGIHNETIEDIFSALLCNRSRVLYKCSKKVVIWVN